MAPLAMMPQSLLPIYLALNATSHVSTATSSDILATISKDLPEASSNPRVLQAAEEVSRARGGELHNISALTGGMVAQEIIKIITKQYVPIDNTCIFDGIRSRTQVLRIWPTVTQEDEFWSRDDRFGQKWWKLCIDTLVGLCKFVDPGLATDCIRVCTASYMLSVRLNITYRS